MDMNYEPSKTKKGERMSPEDTDLVLISKLETISSRCEWIIMAIRAGHDHQAAEEIKALKQALISLNYLTYKDDIASHKRMIEAFSKSANSSSSRVISGPKASSFEVEGDFDYSALAHRMVW